MRVVTFLLFIYIDNGFAKLWPRGVVHYAINKKDYDVHSQDIIMSTFDKLEKEVCVKFFNTPLNYSASDDDKILYISNPDKRKTCPPENYEYEGSVVDMPIGYKCLNPREISRIVMDMLRASVEPVQNVNSFDLMKKFKDKEADPSSSNLLSASDRNFVNAHYHKLCGELAQPQAPVPSRRYGGTMEVTPDNQMYYKDKLWPFGIVMYEVQSKLIGSHDHTLLRYAMTTIELASCVAFQDMSAVEDLKPKNLLWFGETGDEMPHLGFKEGNQTIQLKSMVYGAPGHNGHTLNMLLRALGMPMMSNRIDRDNYVLINWKHVEKGMEHYLEKTPVEAWLRSAEGAGAAYDFDSVTHAPVNYLCKDCSLGAQTVQPLQDHLWQRTLSNGHRTDLSRADIEALNLLYTESCHERFFPQDKTNIRK